MSKNYSTLVGQPVRPRSHDVSDLEQSLPFRAKGAQSGLLDQNLLKDDVSNLKSPLMELFVVVLSYHLIAGDGAYKGLFFSFSARSSSTIIYFVLRHSSQLKDVVSPFRLA